MITYGESIITFIIKHIYGQLKTKSRTKYLVKIDQIILCFGIDDIIACFDGCDNELNNSLRFINNITTNIDFFLKKKSINQ